MSTATYPVSADANGPSRPVTWDAEREALLRERATDVLAAHVPDQYGLCAGCMAQWTRWVIHAACRYAQWAHTIVDGDEAAAVNPDRVAGG